MDAAAGTRTRRATDTGSRRRGDGHEVNGRAEQEAQRRSAAGSGNEPRSRRAAELTRKYASRYW